MASSEEFVRYVVGQLDEAGNIIYKKLFGEYGLWLDGKFFGTIEDNQFYVKVTKAGKKLLLFHRAGGVIGPAALAGAGNFQIIHWQRLPSYGRLCE